MGKTTRLFGRCMRSTIKLRRVRDLYVRSLTELAGSVQPVAAMGSGNFTAMVPSYGFPIEVMSSRDKGKISQPCAEALGSRRAKSRVAPFNQGVMLERIDEDKPCGFGVDARIGSGLLLGRRGI